MFGRVTTPYCDLRALGFFRIYFGSLLLADLVRRWQYLPELYSPFAL